MRNQVANLGLTVLITPLMTHPPCRHAVEESEHNSLIQRYWKFLWSRSDAGAQAGRTKCMIPLDRMALTLVIVEGDKYIELPLHLLHK
jgi:hypothetical protein